MAFAWALHRSGAISAEHRNRPPTQARPKNVLNRKRKPGTTNCCALPARRQTSNDGEADCHPRRSPHERAPSTETFDQQHGRKRAEGGLCFSAGSNEMRQPWCEVKGVSEDLVRVCGDHADAGELLGSLNEEADCDVVEGLGLAVGRAARDMRMVLRLPGLRRRQRWRWARREGQGCPQADRAAGRDCMCLL